MAEKKLTPAEERQKKEDWIRVIRGLLASATVAQLREIYFILSGYLKDRR